MIAYLADFLRLQSLVPQRRKLLAQKLEWRKRRYAVRNRIVPGMSMQEAAKAIGRSKPYIAHIEGGCMNVPKGDKLMQILTTYGITGYKVYYD